MLNFALEYPVPIDEITSNRDLNLRKYELRDEEWMVAQNLCDTLKVCSPPNNKLPVNFCFPRSSRMQLSFFLTICQASAQ